MVKVAVIGAGVIGLSSALRVLEFCPGTEVTVFAHKISPNTTSDISGGFWEPHLLGDTPINKIREWSSNTLNYMMQLALSECAKHTGASLISGYQLSKDDSSEIPFWSDLVKNFRKLSSAEVSQYPNMRSGFFFTTALLEPRLYLPWLMKRFQERGGLVQQRNISAIEELCNEDYAVIVNCTGIGANQLVGDKSVHPIRGQIIRVIAPWVKTFYDGDDFYILPSTSYVVLGGTAYVGDWNTQVNPDDKRSIWGKCTAILPSLKEAKIETDCVGLRPGRPSVRLETEHKHVKGKTVSIIHNYGHGGAGVTLHWGCAENAAKLVKEAIENNRLASAKL